MTAIEILVFEPNELPPRLAPGQASLVRADWNDWWAYENLFRLTVARTDNGDLIDIGYVKIADAEVEHAEGTPACRTQLPRSFSTLPDRFFSLGQSDHYYESLMELASSQRESILHALHDAVRFPGIWSRVRDLDVTRESLLRSINSLNVETQFRRILQGGSRLADYNFWFSPGTVETSTLTFAVTPNSLPPTNVHVVIGSNGVGKTSLLNEMVSAIAEHERSGTGSGRFVNADDATATLFSSVVYVSFSPFDTPPFAEHLKGADKGFVPYHLVGLRNNGSDAPQTPHQLASQFAESATACLRELYIDRWLSALLTLESDPIFAVENVASWTTDDSRHLLSERFSRLSSGHAIVLLTITRLVELVAERTIVLIDEPEAHLHPPLLSAFIGALSALLTTRNGVAILTTHSPVILQEVPKSCVWRLRRAGQFRRADRPQIETYGENVGTLTREIFGLEVTHAGFHREIADLVRSGLSYEAILEAFGGQLGAEAKVIARSLLYAREHEQ